MANAMKCDRCGCYYDSYGDRKTANTLYLQNSDYSGRCECDEKYDLCPNCMDIVKYWLGEDEIKAKPCSGERDT